MSYKITRSDNYQADEKSKQEDIQHWKYIKKKKVNGKWRYYYDVKDALGYDEKEAAESANKEYKKTQQAQEGYHKYKNDQFNNLVDFRGGLDPRTGANKLTPGDKEYLSGLESKYSKLSQATIDAGKRASSAYAAYYNTPLGKLEKANDTIKNGKKRVGNWLRSLGEKLSN